MPPSPRRSARFAAWRADAVLVVLVVAAALIATHVAFRVLLPDTDRDRGGTTDPGSAPPSEPGPTGIATLQTTLEGRVSGLFPGAVVDLPVEIRNPARTEVMVTTVVVEVEDPAPVAGGGGTERCERDSLTVGLPAASGAGGVEVRVSVPVGGSATVAVPVALRPDAPSSCQGVSFPLRYRAEGYLP